jgi:hypothetical protein
VRERESESESERETSGHSLAQLTTLNIVFPLVRESQGEALVTFFAFAARIATP